MGYADIVSGIVYGGQLDFTCQTWYDKTCEHYHSRGNLMNRNKRKITAFCLLLALLMLAGCAGQTKDGLSEKTKELIEQKKNMLTGKKKIAQKERLDTWTPEEKLSDQQPVTLTLDAEDAQAIHVTFIVENEKREWESYTGGADADYAKAQIDGNAPDAVSAIFSEYNEWVDQNVEEELVSGRERWELYHASAPEDYIALTPRVGMELMRCDTRVLSFVTRIHRYNREYEPDDTFVHGYTYDAQTGTQLSLSDLVTDPDALADLLCQMLLSDKSGYSTANEIYGDAGFQDRIRESIEGVRDDGRFAWCVSPIGFQFYIADPFYQAGHMLLDTEQVLVPFALCKDILKQDIDVIAYDHMSAFYPRHVEDVFGTQATLPDGKEGRYYTAYAVGKDGTAYCYLCGNDETLIYRFENGKLSYTGSVVGEVQQEQNGTVCYQDPDPKRFTMHLNTFLVRELSLSAPAAVDQDGQPEILELYESHEYNVEPMSVQVPFEAEVFRDEQDLNPVKQTLPKYTWLNFLRSDGETFIDMQMEPSGDQEGGICRFYVEGDYESGFIVNGHPAEEVLNLQGWLEE